MVSTQKSENARLQPRQNKIQKYFGSPCSRKISQFSPSTVRCVAENEASCSSSIDEQRKREFKQCFLDFGQRDFLFHSCKECGMIFSRGIKEDEEIHRKLHKEKTKSILFPGWQNERVVPLQNIKNGRVIVILPSDPAHHLSKVKEVFKIMVEEMGLLESWLNFAASKVFLFIVSKMVAGCVVAERIKESFQLENWPAKKTQDSDMPEEIHCGKNLEVKLEAKRALEGPHNSSLATVFCGIRAIWVEKGHRRKGIGSTLLTAVRCSFMYGNVLSMDQLAFSQLTGDGLALAQNYLKKETICVYR